MKKSPLDEPAKPNGLALLAGLAAKQLYAGTADRKAVQRRRAKKKRR